MSSQLTTLQTNLLTRLGRPSTDPLLTSANLTLELNYAAHHFSTEYPWSWLETTETIATTNGTDTYAVGTPASYIDTVSLGVSGLPPMVRMSEMELRRQFPTAMSGHPLFYCTTRISSIVVRPVPLTGVTPTMNHVYHKAETAMSGGTDTLLVPVWWEQAVIERAAEQLFMRVNDQARADEAGRRYQEVRDRALERERREQAMSTGNDMVNPMPLAPLPGKPTAAA